MKRYIKADSIAEEVIRVRDALDSGKPSYTTNNKQVATMYKISPKKGFDVKDNGDGSYTISLKSSVKGSEELDDEWSPFHGHKYRIDGGYDIKYADTPAKAIQYWFQLGKKYPMDTAIQTPKKDWAIELCKAATPEVIERFYNKYGSCYKLDYLVDSAAEQVEKGCRFFHEDQYGYGDQIHPFCYG